MHLSPRLRPDLAAIVESSDDAIIGKSLDGIITSWNNGAQRLFGYAEVEAIGRPIDLVIPAELRAKEAAMLARIKKGERIEHLETTGVRKSGERIAMSVTVSPIHDTLGTLIGASRVARDITDRRPSEYGLDTASQSVGAVRARSLTELAASEARVRAIIDANADALLIVDPKGLVRFANPAAAEMFGHGVGTLVGHALGFPLVTDGITEVDVMSGDGREGQAEMRVARIRWDGEDAFLLSLRDVSVRKRAEAALRASEAELRVLTDAMPQIVWVMRAEGRVTHFSQQWTQYTGLTLEESLGRGWVQTLHPDDRSRAWAAWQRSKIDHGIYSVQCRLRRKDGAFNWWLLRAVPMHDAAGALIKWIGTCTDINDLKSAEFEITRANADLWRQRAELQALFNLVPAMIWFKDTENRILKVNQRVADAAGMAIADLEGKSMSEVYPREAAKYYTDDLRVIRSGRPLLAIVERFQDGNGNDGWIQTGKVPYRDKDGEIVGIVVMSQDVTERKRDQDELRVLNAHLEDRVRIRTAELKLARDEAVQANRAKTDFLATMSHEIRTPMNGVVAMIEVLSQTPLGPPQIEMMNLIRTSAFSLLEIVDNILDLSKIEADKLSVENRPMQFCETIETVCCMLQHVARTRRVRISLFVDPRIPHTVLGDQVRLRQILINLAGNALKFAGGRAQPGHVAVRANLIERQATHVLVDLIVADDGIGIDAETLPKLFLPFSQADVSTTRRFGGSGLGLAISSKLAHLMNGTISVQSVLHHGSTFTVRLRFAQPEGPDEFAQPPAMAEGLRCRIVGQDLPLADDLEAYLTHSKVIVTRSADLASATSAERTSGLWLILPSPVVPVVSQLRALACGGTNTDNRFIILKRGIGGVPRLEAPDLVVADADLLSHRTLIQALGLASGRAQSATTIAGQELTSPVRVPDRDEARSQGRLILVAEDHETNREVILRQLQLIGLSAEIASDGREALEMWRTGDFGLLLTDLHMPLMDGYALATSIRNEEVSGSGRRTPIIALTANALLEEERRCLAAGMDAYLSKPVLLAMLKTSIEAWLGPSGAAISKPDPLPVSNIALPVDLNVLREMIGHDPADIDAVLQSFRSSAAAARLDLSTGASGGTGGSTSDVAHKLKSAARSIGALRLGELCAQIEPIAGLARSNELDALMPQVLAELAAVLHFIDARLALITSRAKH